MVKKLRALGWFTLLALVLSLGCPGPKPEPVFIDVEVCAESGDLPNPYCPAREVRKFEQGREPTAVCAVHQAPKVKVCSETGLLWLPTCGDRVAYADEPGPKLVCRLHRKPRFPKVPYMVLFVVDFGSAAHLFPDAELEEFARRLGAAGVGYVRMLLCWKRPGREYTLPFERVGGKADWDRPNPEWDRQMARVQRILGKYGVGIYLDLFAQQFDRRDYPWSPFWNNTDGIESWGATSPKAMRRWRQLIDRVVAAIGTEGNMIGWGNELATRWDYQGDVPQQDEWARAWAIPLGNYMKKIGIPAPIPFSAGHWDGTGKSIYNRLCKQADPVWPWGDTFWVRHGIALAEHVDRDPAGSVLKHWGVSDDGVGLSPQNTVPPEKQGLTVNQTGRRSSHWTWRIEMVRHAKAVWGNRLRLVEVMPMELKRDDWTPSMLHQEESVDVFWRIAKEVYEKDIRRKL